mgnify:CR=1 FL=1
MKLKCIHDCNAKDNGLNISEHLQNNIYNAQDTYKKAYRDEDKIKQT